MKKDSKMYKILDYIFSFDFFTYLCGLSIIFIGVMLLKHTTDPSELTMEVYKLKDILFAFLIMVWGIDASTRKYTNIKEKEQ